MQSWSTQQLAEVLAVLAASGGEHAAIRGASERVAEAFEAEVGAFVLLDTVDAAVGFPAGKVPERELVEAARGALDVLDVPGVGPCCIVVVPVDTVPESAIVLGRTVDDPFDAEEVSLL